MTHRPARDTRHRLAIGLCVAVLVATGCGSTKVEPPQVLRAQGVARLAPSSDAPVAALAAGITGFGYELGRSGVAPTENWVTSPTSIAYAFAMARAGAKGSTATELDKAFGFPNPGVHEAFNGVSAQVVTAQLPPPRETNTRRQTRSPKPPIMVIGNAMFPQSGLAVGEEFLRILAEEYGAGVYPVDFGQDSAKETINAWVQRQTSDRIKKLFDSLPATTKLVIANAVYLKADWEHSFNESTTDGPFRRADGASVTVPMMHLTTSLRYAEGPGWQAVELPYAAGDLAMWVLLPASSGAIRPSPHELLAPASMATISTSLTSEAVQLSMPGWDFETSLDLIAALTRMGVTSAFGPGADFSGIHPGLFIDQAIHRANITVDQWGTEAAAVTGIGMTTSMPIGQVSVVADHPFAFAIVHVPTGVPVFIGHVADPTA